MKINDVRSSSSNRPMRIGRRRQRGSHGVKHCLLLKVSTDEGITGWSDVETAPHVGAAVVNRAKPAGARVFDGLNRLSSAKTRSKSSGSGTKVYRGTIYYGRRGGRCRCCRGSISPARHHGQSRRVGVHKLLGRRPRATGSVPTPQRSSAHARRHETRLRLLPGARVHGDQVRLGRVWQERKRDVALVAAARRWSVQTWIWMVDPGWMVNRSAPTTPSNCSAPWSPIGSSGRGFLASRELRWLRAREGSWREDTPWRPRTGGHRVGLSRPHHARQDRRGTA